MNSETTAAASGKRGVLRADPFAMKPFLGYHAGNHLNHWLNVGAKGDATKIPKIFHVNWFRKSINGNFLWPGFGENIRVLKWIFERCDNAEAIADVTPIGYVPKIQSIDRTGLNIDEETMKELLRVDETDWLSDFPRHKEFFSTLGNKLPDGISKQMDAQYQRLIASKSGRTSLH